MTVLRHLAIGLGATLALGAGWSGAAVAQDDAVLIRKTVAANACIQTVENAFEVVGGGAFFRSVGLERLLRDVHGAQFHPLQEKRQHLFTGRVALGLDPVG